MAERADGPETPTPLYSEREGYLEVHFTPTSSVALVLSQGREMVQYCRTMKPARVLIDFSGLRIMPTTLERYEMGAITSQLAPEVGRVAVVAPRELIDPQKFGVQVANNRGLKLDIFSDRKAALAWLTAS